MGRTAKKQEGILKFDHEICYAINELLKSGIEI